VIADHSPEFDEAVLRLPLSCSLPVVLAVLCSATVAQAAERPDGIPKTWISSPDWWLVIVTAALVVVTAGLWIFTGLMWKATRETTEISRNALIDRERPYICPENVRFLEEDRSVGNARYFAPHFDIALKNYGRTPALVKSLRCGVIISQSGIESEPWVDKTIETDVSIVLGEHEGFSGLKTHLGDFEEGFYTTFLWSLARAEVSIELSYVELLTQTTRREKYDYTYNHNIRRFIMERSIAVID
jgi:hypothetical protein